MDPQLKLKVEAIFRRLGLNATTALNLFYQQVKLTGGLPFPVKIPTALTLKTIRNSDKGIDVIECKDVDEMIAKLGA